MMQFYLLLIYKSDDHLHTSTGYEVVNVQVHVTLIQEYKSLGVDGW